MLKTRFIFAAMAALGSTMAMASQFLSHYDVQFAPVSPFYQISDIMMVEDGNGWWGGYGRSLTWAFGVNSPAGGTLTNPFAWNAVPDDALLLGVTQDLPGDAPGQKHVVLMMSDYAASLAANIAWGTLFRNTNEDQFIADIELATSGQDWSIIQPGLDAVFAFAGGDAETGILDANGSPVSAFMHFGDTFTVMSWSDGTVLGTGQSYATPVPTVPEPTMLVGLAIGALALIRRRKQA